MKWAEEKAPREQNYQKATSQEERLQKWKEHFKNQLGNSPEIIDKPSKEIINGQQDSL